MSTWVDWLPALRAPSSFLLTLALFFGAAPTTTAHALVCGDTILDAGEDCELPFGLCCNPLTCQFQPSSFVCSPGSGDVCDPTETCTGASATCPANVIEPDSTVCRAGSGDLCRSEEH